MCCHGIIPPQPHSDGPPQVLFSRHALQAVDPLSLPILCQPELLAQQQSHDRAFLITPTTSAEEALLSEEEAEAKEALL